MASPKTGTAGSPVAPADPTDPDEADVADPGEIDDVKARQRELKQGKYGSAPVTPFQPPASNVPNPEKTWIEIKLIDSDDQPVPSEKYKIKLPDGRIDQGTLDSNGFARIEGVEPGTCQVTFPDIPGQSWDRA
jgi:hypothetical protein